MFENIKNGWQWALARFWNLFSVVGVIATFYFGLFYIPDYAKENLYSKSALAQGEIIQEIGEAFFAGGNISLSDVKSAIEQKEVFYKINFPFSTKQTLLLIRNDFSKNTYISLEKRNDVRLKIQSLIDSINSTPPEDKKWFKFDYMKVASIILGLLTSIIGFLSIIDKNKKDAEVEIELDEENIPFEEGTISRRGYEYSKMVGEVLKEMNLTLHQELKATPQQPVFGPEFEVSTQKGNLLIETKAYRQKVGVNTMRGFLYRLRESEKPGVLISTSTLTMRAKQILQEHNAKNKLSTAYFISGVTKGDIKSGLQSLIGG
ncbi:restriction endonuclease [Aeromonas piscicola]|uniref:Restriction endonuclease n=1 Tax=Aeromonas piscicola TaxID=600645 RepID=A0ABT7QD17_9GAMM|nr:restriction endonuclease [Aeromonas piscicola]MDM5131849.1 restriction endonuclease [Aeromonas piscicola]